MDEKYSGALRNVSVFGALTDPEFGALAAIFREVAVAPGEEVVREGEVTDAFFVVKEGTLNIFKGPADSRIFISVVGDGEYFGEAALFSNTSRSATVAANDRVLLLRTSREQLLGFFDAHPPAGKKILLGMLQELFFRLSQTSMALQSARKGSPSQADIDRLFA